MEITEILITLAGIAALGIMSPGPDFVAVTHASITSTKVQAAAVAMGVVLGNGIWAGAALFGIGALFVLFPFFFFAFKVIGGLYLIWMGYGMVRKARNPISTVSNLTTYGKLGGFSKGLSTTMANPKAAVYYASALTVVAPADASFSLLSLMLLVVMGVAAAWFTCVVLFLSTKKASAIYKSIKIYIESVFGSLIMLFGLKQIFSK